MISFETPEAHATWCRDQAFAYLDGGNIRDAYSALVSDLKKGPFKPTKIMAAKLRREGQSLVMMKDGAGLRELIAEVTYGTG